MPKTIFLIFLLSVSSFSQDEMSGEERYREKIRKEYGSGKLERGTRVRVDEASQKELEDELEETAEILSNPAGMMGEGEEPERESEPVALKDSYLTGLMSAGAKKFVSSFLSENPFSRVPERELRSLIQGRLAGMPFGKMLNENPKAMDVFVDFLRDKEALPSILGLVNKPEKVKTFGLFAIGVFLMVFILNLFNSKGNIFRRIFRKLGIGLLAFVCNISAFYFIFKDEIGPTLNIILKHYHL